jgi:hypothetical protein
MLQRQQPLLLERQHQLRQQPQPSNLLQHTHKHTSSGTLSSICSHSSSNSSQAHGKEAEEKKKIQAQMCSLERSGNGLPAMPVHLHVYCQQ